MTAPLVSTTDRPYQLLPPLTVEQRDLLRQSIKENGVLEPVVFDEDGEILDGHHRVEIAEELGIEYPRRVIDDLDRPGKHMYALTVNVARRQLDQSSRGSLVAQMRIRGMSIRRIAETLGVSVGTVHSDLKVFNPEHLPEEITGADGKSYAATRPAPAPDLTSDVERALTSAGPTGMTAWQLAFLIDPAGPDAARAELAVRMAPILEQLAAERRARVVGAVDGGLLWAFADPSWPTEDELKPWESLDPPADRVAESLEPVADDPRDRTHGAEFESYDATEPKPTQTPEPVTAPTVPVAGSGSPSPEPEPPVRPVRHLSPVPSPAVKPTGNADLEAELAADSTRRASIRNLTSVLTFLNPVAIAPVELAEREYAPVLDEFDLADLERAAATLNALVALKRGER